MRGVESKAGAFEQRVERETRRFVERIVIGLGLCPFARVPWEADRVAVVVSHATSEAALLEDLAREVDGLVTTAPEALETTLLVHPRVLASFEAFNAFLDPVDALLAERGLEGVLQIASFHPDYRFAGAPEGDPANATNRSPWPMLHVLREASIAAAVEAYPDADAIPERNVELLRGLGEREVQALLDGLQDAAATESGRGE